MFIKTSMSATLVSTILLLWLLYVAAVAFGFSYGGCSQTEKDALLKFKHDLKDPSDRLASWVVDGDCCRWTGVVCDNVTGHVIDLHLRAISIEELFGLGDLTEQDAQVFIAMEELFGWVDLTEYDEQVLSGKINPSLLNLNHLRHLDLSNNDFKGIPIPKFIGSMRSLQYLNLSEAGFGGMIPHQLGNLSNLHYLNLRGNFHSGNRDFFVENLDWLSNLSSLEFLDLSNVNLEKAFDWLEVTNALPSLVELRLSSCQLPAVTPPLHVNFSSLSVLDFSSINPFVESRVFKQRFPSWVFHIKALISLNLAGNDLQGPIPNDLRNMTSLRKLDLSSNQFGSSFPNWLYGFSHLEILKLRANNLQGELSSAIGNMTSLRELDLSSNQFSSLFSNWLYGFSHLEILKLGANNLQGELSSAIGNMTSLRELDLSSNQFSSLFSNWLYGFSHLEILKLGANNLQGELSSVIGNMTSLIILDLSSNDKLEFERGFPLWFKDLRKLRMLSLSYVKLNSDIADLLEILSRSVSDKLESLDLANCQLSGNLPNHLGQFGNLTYLSLRGNSISGQPPMSLGKLVSLVSLDVSTNMLNGTLPNCFGGLKKLAAINISCNMISGPIPMSFRELRSLRSLVLSNNRFNGTISTFLQALTKLVYLDISENSLEGVVSETQFANLTKLRTFDAGGNQMVLNVNPDWIPPLKLVILNLTSWNIGPQFPIWLRSLEILTILDLSNCSISSAIPNWFWKFSSQFLYLGLSHNQIHGEIPSKLEFSPCNMYTSIDLSSNHFEGPLPSVFSEVAALDLSNNSFSGSISNFLCHEIHKTKNMTILNLGENLLSGELPDCWMSWKNLEAVKLSNNKFSGSIPMSIGTLTSLQSLHLQSNSLSGELPTSLQNCTKLVTLDIGGNEFVGNIPTWIGAKLLGVVILSLRGNKFHGQIPKELCNLSALQILDLAHNRLLGSIPQCINNFSAMVRRNDSFGEIDFISEAGTFSEHASLVLKGYWFEYKRTLKYVRSIDISNNVLSGEIPKEVTSLGELVCLNLSRNFLTGGIPKDIGAMRQLECIDFSSNQLSGEIPQSMSNLSFLSHLNLSDNKLQGKIPLGTQLQSFDPSSFMGNQLCGPPLPNCSTDGDGPVPDIKNGNSKIDVNWFYMGMPLGFVVGFWGVVGPLLFNRRWRYAYFRFLDRLGDKFLWRFM